MVRNTHPDQQTFDFEADPRIARLEEMLRTLPADLKEAYAKRLHELTTKRGTDLIRFAVGCNFTTMADEQSAWNEQIQFMESGDMRSGRLMFGGPEHQEFIDKERRPVFLNILKVMMENHEPIENTRGAVKSIRIQQRQFMRSLARRTKKK